MTNPTIAPMTMRSAATPMTIQAHSGSPPTSLVRSFETLLVSRVAADGRGTAADGGCGTGGEGGWGPDREPPNGDEANGGGEGVKPGCGVPPDVETTGGDPPAAGVETTEGDPPAAGVETTGGVPTGEAGGAV